MKSNKIREINLLIVHLTSSDVTRLKRGIFASNNLFSTDGCPIKINYDIHVVVNSKNPEYIKTVREHVSSKDASLIVQTHSDGTPGTGKNSVFEHFRRCKKKYDYIFQVDGDDFLYPCALRQLSHLLHVADMPDAVSFQSMDWFSTNFTDQMPYSPIIPDRLWLYSWRDEEINLREIPAFTYVTDPKFGSEGRIFTPGTSMILSRKFLTEFEYVKHTNEISLFEDYLYYLKLFALHVQGKIKMVHTNNTYFYVYDKANITSISTKNCFYTNKEINLLTSFVKSNKIEDKHPKDDLPFITLGSPVDSFCLEDKPIYTQYLLKKFPVSLESLDMGSVGKNARMVFPPTMQLNTNPNIKGPRIALNP